MALLNQLIQALTGQGSQPKQQPITLGDRLDAYGGFKPGNVVDRRADPAFLRPMMNYRARYNQDYQSSARGVAPGNDAQITRSPQGQNTRGRRQVENIQNPAPMAYNQLQNPAINHMPTGHMYQNTVDGEQLQTLANNLRLR